MRRNADSARSMKKTTTEILYGFHPVAEALAAGRRKIHEVWISRDSGRGRVASLTASLASHGVPVHPVAARVLASHAGTERHQGIAASVTSFPMTGTAALLTLAAADGSLFFLMLDRIVDPQNLGALLRSAEGVGAAAVILPKDRSASPTPAVSKASAGAMEHLRITVVTNLVQTMQQLKDLGYWCYGLDSRGGHCLFDTPMTGKIVLLVGGEEKGLRHLVRGQCDVLISIPQQGTVGSLNASAAGAVAMYERCRQQRKLAFDGEEFVKTTERSG
jgi:23S rRNA (guanosine2251-2'-O)-methyltransferase